MSGAICGGAPFVWKVDLDPKPRWCFGERKHLPGRWVLRAAWDKDKLPLLEDGSVDPVVMWGPMWTYECSGCNDDRRSGGFFEAWYPDGDA